MLAGTKLRDMPGRIATGLYILNSGVGKRTADAETAAKVHGPAAGAYPVLKGMTPESFVSTLSKAELVLGSALLIPWVPTKIAGTGLAAFSGGLVGMYLRTPALREEGSLRPSAVGGAIAKDVWMLGMSLGFLIDAFTRGKK